MTYDLHPAAEEDRNPSECQRVEAALRWPRSLFLPFVRGG